MTDIKVLKRLRQFVDRMDASTGNIERKKIMGEYSDLKPIFKLIWDPQLNLGVTRASLQTRSQKIIKDKKIYTGTRYTTIFDLLTYLTKDTTPSSNNTRDSVLNYIDQYPEFTDLIYRIMDKKKKQIVSMGIKSVQKVFPGLLCSFEVASGVLPKNAINHIDKSIVKDKIQWFISRKYDGVRAIIICTGTMKNPKVCVFSKQGNTYHTVQILIDYIIQYIIPAYIEWEMHGKDDIHEQSIDLVLDGEVMVFDENGKENFAETISQIKRKDYQMPDPYYKVFDMLTNDEFCSCKSSLDRIFSIRTEILTAILSLINVRESERVSQIMQYPYTPELFADMKQQHIQNGWEGLIIRKDVPYKGAKINHIIKVKRGGSVELEVIRIITGTQPTKRDDGTMKDEELLTAVVVKYKGVEVFVGTGFLLKEKREYYATPNLIIKKTIRVNYMEVTNDGSLRHPSFKGIVEDNKKEMS